MEGIFGDVVFLDKYNQEWELKVPSELRGLTQNGISIMRQEIDLGGPSNLNFPTPGTFYVPPPNPSYTYTPRPVPTRMRVSFADTRPPLGPYGPRPMGSGTYVRIEWSSGKWSANPTTTYTIDTYTFDNNGL